MRVSRVVALWAAFLVVHVLVGAQGWLLPGMPAGDVVLVYEPWSRAALGGAIPGVTETWVYPQLALIPMLLARALAAPFAGMLAAADAYQLGWLLLVTSVDAVGFAVLLGRGDTRRRRIAGWFWIAALVLLGPIALYRIDAITVPLAVMGVLWLAQRPRVAAALLTVGAWIKIWPGAVLLAAVSAGRHRVRMLVGAAAVMVAIVGSLLIVGTGDALLGFLGTQSERGLQIEAVAATPLLWMVLAGGARIEYSLEILTYEIVAPAADATAAVLTPLMIVFVLAIVALGAWRSRAGASWQQLLPPLTIALTTALIVCNKVGSPQFQTWLIAPIVFWIVYDRARSQTAAALVLVLCALTFSVYPLTYAALLSGHPLPMLLLTVRNLLLVVLLVHAVRTAWRTHAPERTESALHPVFNHRTP